MNTKQRDAIYQRWIGMIRRETRDVGSLEQMSARALADPDVRDDATLQSMILSDIHQRRAELERELQNKQSPAISSKCESKPGPVLPDPAPPVTPEQNRVAFNRLAQSLCAALERSDENEIGAIFGKMRLLKVESPEAVPAGLIAHYERRVGELRSHLQHLRDQITALAKQAIAAARHGNDEDLAGSMRRLLAIHTAHPRLLDGPRLEGIRAGVLQATEERRQHQLTTRKLLERERAIAAEIKKLAAAVHAFHQAACAVPTTSDEFRDAEVAYLRAIQEVRACDAEWFSGVVLELADLLAEWTIPPLEAGGQIDRFLDSINVGLESIRAEIREIETEQDSKEGDARASAAPRRPGGD